ncbi:MAG: phosphodiester glycosidase family protein, partial [Clostridia bacterium]|nr:phosphodiester glycosidase family protein [Clostridia bacterium]
MKKLSRGLISVLLAAALMLSMCAAASAAVLQPAEMTLVSDKETLLAPGIVQNEAVAYTANNDRLSYYAATIDLSNPTNHLIANYKDNQTQEFGMQTVTDQIDATEAKHQGENFRIVVATNSSYYNMTTGRPRGAFIMNGVDNTLENVALVDPVTGGTKRDAEGNIVYGSEGDNFGFFAIKKDGTPMLGYIGEFSQYRDQLQEACATHGILVRNGENVVSPTINQAKAPETLVGLTADNKVVLLVCDGRQAPYSIGINFYEGANLMLSMGCVNACALDGGGSSTYVCRRPGAEDYQVVNRPSDGAPRSVSNTIMVYSTAAPTGVVQSADVFSDYDYLSPGSSVKLSANGVDICGYPAELPEGAYFTLSDDSMGSVEGNIFTAGSEYGDVTVNCMYDGKLLGSHELHIIRPESIAWTKSVIVATYGERTTLPLVAYYQGEFVAINGDDLVTLCGPIEELVDKPETYGYVDGLDYVAPDERCGIRSAPIYAMLAWDTESGDTIIQSKVELHRASESVFDFDSATVNLGFFAYNRDINNTYTEDNVNYYIQNSQSNVEVSYTMAINLEDMRFPEDLQPLWDAFGEGLGGSVWGGFLRIANKIDENSSVTVKLDFPDTLVIADFSDVAFSCPLFDVDRESVTIDPETNTLIIPLLWNKSYVQSVILETGSIDPVDVDPIGVLTGIKAVLGDDVDFGASERLPVSASAVVEYKMIALSSSAYNAARTNEDLNKYMYIDPVSERPGICVFGEYINTTDSFVLHSQILDGWDSAGTSYTVNGVKLKGAQVIDGSVYYFDENGILDSTNAYSGMINGLDGE